MAKIPGLPIAFICLGGVLVWSGIENEPVTAIFRSLASGKAPAKGAPETFATPGTASTATAAASGATATGSAIANDALTYVGHPYVWGGNSNIIDGWDCSSFVSWVLGHDLGMAIPGGSWATVTANGSQHGPNVASYVLWSGATGIPKAQVQAGDLICYPPDTHIAIAISATQGVSAEDPKDGTGTGPLDDGPGPWIARRVRAAQ